MGRWAAWLTAGPGGLYLIAFTLAPLLLVVYTSLLSRSPSGETIPPFGFHNYLRFFSDPLYLWILGQSLWMGLVSTLLTLLLGYPLAFFIAGHPRKQLLLLLLTVPFLTNFLIRVYAWIVVLQTEGLLNAALSWVGLGPVQFFPSNAAVYLVTVYTFLPFFVLPLYATVERIDWKLLEAAYDLGAGRIRGFWLAIFPQTLPGLLAGFVLVFVPAVGTFVISDLLGGGKVVLIGNLVQQQFGVVRDWAFGSAISLILVGLVLLGLWAYARSRGQQGLDGLV